MIVVNSLFDGVDDDTAARLSRGGEALLCSVSDTVMVSSVAWFRDGSVQWHVLHDSGESLMHLEVAGSPPAEFDSIRSRLVQEQEDAGGEDADVDNVYDVPIELAEALTGYRHDAIPDEADEAFEVLAAVADDPSNPTAKASSEDPKGPPLPATEKASGAPSAASTEPTEDPAKRSWWRRLLGL